ncbi:MAG TPA: BlaI/MecI/CopY family transcriptional regulator [Thermoanaerobaculia bacterium]|nr:BlaI/MecI/CopY family transcriptional regulator [Thermoanaerobaculia bacterium]
MARRKADQLTPLELAIMNVLWDTGPASVTLVQSRLRSDLAYTTVQTMLNVLWRKKKVKRVLVERAYHYRPAVTKQRAMGQAVRDLVRRAFGGSAEALVLSLVETRQLTPEALRRLQKLVDEEETRDE